MPTVLGRMCLKMIRRLDAPATRAASTNSRSRSARNSARTSRASPVHRNSPSTSATLHTPLAPSAKPATAAISSSGMMMMTSVKRISTESIQPPK